MPNAVIYFKRLVLIVSMELNMSKTCEICGKHPVSGKTVSHAHNVNLRVLYPNLRTIKTVEGGRPVKKKICMKCLKTMAKS